MDAFWDTESISRPMDLFTPTPAPVDESPGPTPLPRELIPENTRATVKPTTLRPGAGQWDVKFESDAIGRAMTSAQLIEEQQKRDAEQGEDEYDGPTPTGKGLNHLAESLGLPPSLGVLFEDMQEAIIGITRDLTGSSTERESLTEILTHENRLRGIGALLVLVAVVGLVIDSFAETEKTSTLLSQVMDLVKK